MSEKKAAPVEKVKCGIIMPLSEIDGCSAGHWQEVLYVIKESLADTPFEPEVVSNADESGVIQKRIVTNLHENPIAICDVSAKNPNVMFELGMRLAFDKPTVVIKDDKTAYSFDTSPIAQIPYPRDLYCQQIVDFKSRIRASGKFPVGFVKGFYRGNYTGAH